MQKYSPARITGRCSLPGSTTRSGRSSRSVVTAAITAILSIARIGLTTSVSCIAVLCGLLCLCLWASDLRVAHFLTNRALHTGPVPRFGTFSTRMTELVTVSALHNSLIGTIWLTVTFLTTVVADVTTSLRAVATEVTNFTTLLAFNTLCRSRLGALLRRMARLLAVAASELVRTRIWAITHAVTDTITVIALYFCAVCLVLVLLTLVADVAKFTTI